MAIKMENQVLSIEQMDHLKELGIDTSGASMAWQRGWATRHEWVLYAVGNMSLSLSEKERTFTLQDMIDLMPKNLNSSTELRVDLYDDSFSYWAVRGWEEDELIAKFTSNKLLTSAYEMLCWLAENDYLINK